MVIWFCWVNLMVLLMRFYRICCKCVLLVMIWCGNGSVGFRLKCNFFCCVCNVERFFRSVRKLVKLIGWLLSWILCCFILFMLIILLKIFFSVMVEIWMVLRYFFCSVVSLVFSRMWFRLMILFSGVCNLWLMVEINVVLLWLVCLSVFWYCLCLVMLWLKFIKLWCLFMWL